MYQAPLSRVQMAFVRSRRDMAGFLRNAQRRHEQQVAYHQAILDAEEVLLDDGSTVTVEKDRATGLVVNVRH